MHFMLEVFWLLSASMLLHFDVPLVMALIKCLE